jgi:hypothetical protein
MSRIQLSVFISDDQALKAIVYLDTEKKVYEVEYTKNDAIIATESYEDKSLNYHEDAAENYVMGIKKI